MSVRKAAGHNEKQINWGQKGLKNDDGWLLKARASFENLSSITDDRTSQAAITATMRHDRYAQISGSNKGKPDLSGQAVMYPPSSPSPSQKQAQSKNHALAEKNAASQAMMTIGQLSEAVNVKPRILRYWEAQFPMLKPLTRAGRRRYYRAEDVALVRLIDHLVNGEGYTTKGACQYIRKKGKSAWTVYLNQETDGQDELGDAVSAIAPVAKLPSAQDDTQDDTQLTPRKTEGSEKIVNHLSAIRSNLADILADS